MKSKVISILVSIAIALGVWFYVVTVVSPNSDKSFRDIKVETVGEKILNDNGLMITNMDDLSTVTLHLEGNRVDLNKLSSDNINISMDVSKISEPGTHNLAYTVSYPGDVAQNSITVLNKDPGSVKVIVEERISKTVPVDKKYSGQVADGYVPETETAALDVENVIVTGPKAVIELVHMARIDVNLDGRNKSFRESFAYTLCDKDGNPVDAKHVVTDVAEVNLELRIVQIKEIPLDVEIIAGGGATREDCTITFSTETIKVSGNETALAGLENLVLGTIDLSQITEKTTTVTFAVKLPEGVENKTGITEVEVSLVLPDLETKTLKIKNIRVENGPAEVDEKEIEVILRGPAENIKNLTAANVTVVVDCAGKTSGQVEARIICTDEKVGAVGTYIVTVTIG